MNAKKWIAIRVDASQEIGSGHVMRCLTLARELKKFTSDIVFICRDHPGHLVNLITEQGYACELLSSRDKVEIKSEALDSTCSAWLGVTSKQDACDTLDFIGNRILDVLIVDHYALDFRWHRALKAKCKKIVVIDDLANRPLECDFLLDQNFYSNPDRRYESLVPKKCEQLLGPNYALLREEFLKVQHKKSDKVKSGFRVFVFMGGVDRTNETGKVVNVLLGLIRSNLISGVDVVVGSTNQHEEYIKGLCDASTAITFHKNTRNIAELMSAADISVGAGGATTLERCYLGLPSLVILLAENQCETSNDLESVGAIKILGWHNDVSAKSIKKVLENLIKTPMILSKMKNKSLSIFSKNEGGASLVAKTIWDHHA